MADRDAWEQCLYHFARLLTRDAALARQIVTETLEEGIRRRPAQIEPERLMMLQFRSVRRRLVRSSPPLKRGSREPLAADAAGLVSRMGPEKIEESLHGLPEPGRSALILLLLNAMEAEWIAKLLALERAEFAEAVHSARLGLYQALSVPSSEMTSP